MFVDFNRVFNNKPQAEGNIPAVFLEYLNTQVPAGVKYIINDKGNCEITGENGPYTIGGYIFRPTEQQKKILGNSFTYDDLFKYFYNAQKPVPLELKREGYLTINGEEFPIDKMSYNPLHPIKYVEGSFCLVPSPFPEPFELEVGCGKYTRRLLFSRVPNESVNVLIFESAKETPLQIRYLINEEKGTITFNVSFNLKYAKTIRDMVETTMIYNAYLEGEGVLCGQPLQVAINDKKAKLFDKKSAVFWEKVLMIEQYLKVSYTPPQEDVDLDKICLVEQLYQNLILKNPVRYNQIINSIDGECGKEVGEKIIAESIGKPIYFEFEMLAKFDLFGVKHEFPTLLGVFNAIVSDYKINNGLNTVYLADESDEKRRYTSIMSFVSEKELQSFKNGDYNERIEKFHDAKYPQEYL